jgi:hypothetical protein
MLNFDKPLLRLMPRTPIKKGNMKIKNIKTSQHIISEIKTPSCPGLSKDPPELGQRHLVLANAYPHDPMI